LVRGCTSSPCASLRGFLGLPAVGRSCGRARPSRGGGTRPGTRSAVCSSASRPRPFCDDHRTWRAPGRPLGVAVPAIQQLFRIPRYVPHECKMKVQRAHSGALGGGVGPSARFCSLSFGAPKEMASRSDYGSFGRPIVLPGHLRAVREQTVRQVPCQGSLKYKPANSLAFLFNTAETRTTAESRRVFQNAFSDAWEHPELHW
jgi:hypothetical protein